MPFKVMLGFFLRDKDMVIISSFQTKLPIMSSYKELLVKKAELERQIATQRSVEVASAIANVKELIEEFNLTEKDIFTSRLHKTSGVKVEAKYRDPATGATWSGRGKPPRWIQGKERSDFTIKS